MCHVIPTFTTKVLHVVTYVQRFQVTGKKVKVTGYAALAYSY